MKEKRQNPRFACSKKGKYAIIFDDADKPAHLSNFSRDGLSIRSQDPLEENGLYAFTIAGDGLKASVPCQARIMWVQRDAERGHHDCGARIVKMEPSDKIDLIEILYQDWKRGISSSKA